MKTATDPRHLNRITTVKELFANTFTSQSDLSALSRSVLQYTETIDKLISSAAPTWPIESINRMDLAILRLGVYELKYTDTPPKVVIDEAVELGKQFGSENTASFVNGVLGAVIDPSDVKENE